MLRIFRRRLSFGCAGPALLAIPAVMGLGVGASLAQTTIGPNNNAQITLSAAGNPFTIAAGSLVTNSNISATYVIYGPGSATALTITNAGTIAAAAAFNERALLLVGLTTLTNSGTIRSDAAAATALFFNGGGPIVNTASGSISGGTYAIDSRSDAPTAVTTILNSGTISSAGNYAIRFGLGTIVNLGTIAASKSPVYFSSVKPGTLTNSGALIATGAGSDGVKVPAFNVAVNQSGATITGVAVGAYVGGGGTFVNNGTVKGGTGLVFLGDNSLVINTGTIISTTGPAIDSSSSDAMGTSTFVNTGVLIGGNGVAIQLGGGTNDLTLMPGSNVGGSIVGGAGPTTTNNLTLPGSGTIGGSVVGFQTATIPAGAQWTFDGTNSTIGTVALDGSLAVGDATHPGASLTGIVVVGNGGTLVNSGSVTNLSTAVFLGAGGSVVNLAGATISGGSTAVLLTGLSTVTNAGTLSGLGGPGILVGGGGSVVNQAGGTISGTTAAVQFSEGGGTLVNQGALVSTAPGSVGISVPSGSTFINAAGASVTGGAYGATVGSGGRFTNTGTLRGATGLGITGTGSYTLNTGTIISTVGPGVNAATAPGSNNTFVNTGAITGANGVAIQLGFGNNVLTLTPSSVINGSIVGGATVGGAGAYNALTLQGTGSLPQVTNFQSVTIGPGAVWTLNGSAGLGTVNLGGSLAVGDAAHPSAALTGSVVVASGGLLSGHGTVIGNVNSNGGTVRPGGSIGTLTINGNFTQNAQSVLLLEVSPTAASNLSITGVATLAGTLELLPQAGIFHAGTTLPIIQANGGIVGTFATLTSAPAGLLFHTTNVGNVLNIVYDSGTITPPAGITPNELAIAQGLFNNPNPALLPIIAAINALPPALQDEALNQLGGEVYTASRTAMQAAMTNFLETLTEERSVTTAPVAGASGLTTWASAFGGFTKINGDANASAIQIRTVGELQGADLPYISDLPFFADGSLGLALGYTRSTISLQNVPQTGTLSSYNFGTRGKQHWGEYFFDWGVAGTYQRTSIKRNIDFIKPVASNGGFDTLGFGGRVIGRRAFRPDPQFEIEPAAGFAFNAVFTGATSETGFPASLVVPGTQQSWFQSILGLRMTNYIPMAGGTLEPELRFLWEHEFGNATPPLTSAFPGGGQGHSFTIGGANPGHDAAHIGVALTYITSDKLLFYAQFEATPGTHGASEQARAGVKLAW